MRQKLCRWCEYFDGGGRTADGTPREYHGDCLNSLSDRFTTTQDDWCRQFLLDTTLPLAAEKS